MTNKVRRLLEELGAAAAEPVHGSESPKEHTPEFENSDVFPADEHEQAEEIEEVIVEAFELLEYLESLTESDFIDVVTNASYEEKLIMEQSLELLSSENVQLVEGLIFGRDRGVIKQAKKDSIDAVKTGVGQAKSEYKKNTSKGFLGLGGAKGKFIKAEAKKAKQKMAAKAAKTIQKSENLKKKSGESQEAFAERKQAAILAARRQSSNVGRDAKNQAKQSYTKYESGQKQKLSAAEQKGKQSIQGIKKASAVAGKQDFKDNSVLGKGLAVAGKGLGKVGSGIAGVAKNVGSGIAGVAKNIGSGIANMTRKAQAAKATKQATQANQKATQANQQGKKAKMFMENFSVSFLLDEINSLNEEQYLVFLDSLTLSESVELGSLLNTLTEAVDIDATEDSHGKSLKVSFGNKDIYPADQHEQAEEIEEVIVESYTREELIELFEALNLDTDKYTFEYLAEELGFAAAEPVHGSESPKEHTPEFENSDVFPADEHEQAEEIEEVIVESQNLSNLISRVIRSSK
jgi:hypothetical protein